MSEHAETPNVVVENPQVRKAVNVIISSVGIILGTVIVVDLASPDFTLNKITEPLLAAYLYLSSVFGITVTVPNIPKR